VNVVCALQDAGFDACFYHAGLADDKKRRLETSFACGDVRAPYSNLTH